MGKGCFITKKVLVLIIWNIIMIRIVFLYVKLILYEYKCGKINVENENTGSN